MLKSYDPKRVLIDFKLNLYRNYNNFQEEYAKIDDGYIVKTHVFKQKMKKISNKYQK
jgi:hypothetical protein